MERQNISPVQVRKFHRRQNNYDTKSNVVWLIVDDNFIPYDSIYTDALLNIIEENEAYQTIYSSDIENWSTKEHWVKTAC